MTVADESLGELSRRFDRYERDMRANLSEIRRECQATAALHVDTKLYATEKAHMASQLADVVADLAKIETHYEQKIQELKERLTWATRGAITGVVFPVIVLLVGWFFLQGRP